MHLLLRAIITGFGYKIGSELGRLFAERVGLRKPEGSKSSEQQGDEDEMPRSVDDEPGDEPGEPGDPSPSVRAV
jgi:hypothetical protein